jgi:ubiquitin-like 1-activating enzyme E1 B
MALESAPRCGFAGARALDAMYGRGAAARVSSARVLVVGAGGVGCELVKGLACAGFSRVTLVDLDTIDVSNLNRQFLFRRAHVGMNKSEVAAEAVEGMVDGVAIEGVIGNIKEGRFGVDWVRGFDVVCNALDNLEARRHVNRMCLAAGVCLVESGSTGYLGQATVIGRGVECYDCTTKPPQKTYAVCTIRSTPDKPVHCIVWARHLWELVFGADDEGNVLRDLDGGGAGGDQEGAGAENGGGGKEAEANGGANEGGAGGTGRAKRVRLAPGEDENEFASRVAERVFFDDITEQAAMKTLWAKDGRTPPTPYRVPQGATVDLPGLNLLEPRVWSREESAAVFTAVLARVARERAAEIGRLSFDKDDRDALAFVVAASNLRAAAFGVELQSPFAVKGIAGNIVHAIATTNAMVAGLVVLEAIKVVVAEGDAAAKLAGGRSTYVRKFPSGEPPAPGRPARRRMLLMTEGLNPPNPSCYVCSKGMLPLSVDADAWTLKTLVDAVVRRRLAVVEPTVSVTTGDFHNTLLESGQGLEDDEVEMYEANMGRTLRELRVETGSQLSVDDCTQNFSCTLIVTHVEKLKEEAALADRYSLEGSVPEAEPDAPAGAAADAAADGDGAKPEDDDDDDDDDECVVVGEGGDELKANDKDKVRAGRKRPLDAGAEKQPASKRGKPAVDGGDTVDISD